MSRNKVELTGVVARNPEMNYKGDLAVLKFTLAVGRERGNGTDYIRHVVFGSLASKMNDEIGEGMEINVEGRIQTGSYINRDGVKVYTTDVVVASYSVSEYQSEEVIKRTVTKEADDGFMSIPDGLEEELPFQ